MHELHELKEKIHEELAEYAGTEITAANLDTIDKLARIEDKLCKIIERCEDGYSGHDYGSYRRANQYGSYEGSYAPKRDSMGRYSRDNKMLIGELHELMNEAPDERTKKELRHFISKMESM